MPITLEAVMLIRSNAAWEEHIERAKERARWVDVGHVKMKRMEDGLFYTREELDDPQYEGLKPWED